MIFHPALLHGKLLKRYKRFLADVKLDTGEIITAHCTNSGSMKSCIEIGAPVYISLSSNPERKTKYTWEKTAAAYLALIEEGVTHRYDQTFPLSPLTAREHILHYLHTRSYR